MKLFIVFFVLFISSSAHCFDYRACKQWNRRHYIVEFPIHGLTTTSQFTTSTGPCAMIGELEHDKKLFIVQNYDELKMDVAMGGGKTLEGYASLSKVAYSDDLKKSLQMSYANIFKRNELDVEDIYRGLECQMSQKGACVI